MTLLKRGMLDNGAAVSATDIQEIAQTGTYLYGTATGTDTYAVTLSPAPTAYATGNTYYVNFTNANTGVATINVNSLGAKSLKKAGGAALSSGDIVAGTIYRIVYDGTNFQLDISNIGTWTGWVPTITGFSAGTPTYTYARYTLIGKMCTVSFAMSAQTSNATTLTITLPFTAAEAPVLMGSVCTDNGAGQSTSPRFDLAAGSNVATVYKAPAGTAWTASGSKNIRFTFIYEIQ